MWDSSSLVYVSQLHADGSGWNDCGEACIAAYAESAGKLPTQPAATALDTVHRLCTGLGDQPGQGITSYGEMERGMRALGIPFRYTESYDDAAASPWAIVLVTAIRLRPAQYDPSWLGWYDGPDHFILWLPAINGGPNWFMDPLNPNRAIVEYDPASVQSAWSSAYLLGATGHGDDSALLRVKQNAALKVAPDHTCKAACMVRAGAYVAPLGPAAHGWRRVRTNGFSGYLLADNLA